MSSTRKNFNRETQLTIVQEDGSSKTLDSLSLDELKSLEALLHVEILSKDPMYAEFIGEFERKPKPKYPESKL